jgi:hypothetical protein
VKKAKDMADHKSEQVIQREILDRLVLMPGVYAWRQNCGSFKIGTRFIRFGMQGSADISGVIRGGRRLEIEVKTKTGRLSEAQELFGARINELGGLWFVARTADEAIQRVQEALV